MNKRGFSGSYPTQDVEFLLKPADIAAIDVEQKEQMIQSGVHYSEMLSPEEIPGAAYMACYHDAMARNAGRLKGHIETLCDKIASEAEAPTIISLARAGTPIGVLMQRELVRRGLDSRHYSMSIIRGRGLDQNALDVIKAERNPSQAYFVDGWTGKGAIGRELSESLENDKEIAARLLVVADPAGISHFAATTEDYVIPSGILNGIVSGLISRTVLNDEYVGLNDFHATLFQSEMLEQDVSNDFIREVEKATSVKDARPWTIARAAKAKLQAEKLIKFIVSDTCCTDINRIKPGIAEATRAILRRVPDRVYLRDPNDPEVQHIVAICREKGKDIRALPESSPYRAVTYIKKVSE